MPDTTQLKQRRVRRSAPPGGTTPGSRRVVLAAVVGGLLGFAFGALLYVVANPYLEESGGIIRELQGFLWNVVPLLTVGGAVGGWLLARRR